MSSHRFKLNKIDGNINHILGEIKHDYLLSKNISSNFFGFIRIFIDSYICHDKLVSLNNVL